MDIRKQRKTHISSWSEPALPTENRLRPTNFHWSETAKIPAVFEV